MLRATRARMTPARCRPRAPFGPGESSGPRDVPPTSRDGNADVIARIAETILHYLGSHPHAADTAEGITDWWIPRQRIQEAMANVQVALDQLVVDGRVEAMTGHDGQIVYRLCEPHGGERG